MFCQCDISEDVEHVSIPCIWKYWSCILSRPDITLKAWESTALYLLNSTLAFLAFGLVIYFYIRKDKLSAFVRSSIHFFAPFIGLVKKGFDHRAYADAVESCIDSFHGGLKDIHHNKNGLVKATMFSFFGWVFDIMAIYTVFLALGFGNIHISVLILTYTISMMSGWLPLFLPGGLGIVDTSMAVLFIVVCPLRLPCLQRYCTGLHPTGLTPLWEDIISGNH